tara:strand:+ start:2720 stop:3568 length:849 start_codon:yes stop_codon:yes gene_type:complete
MKIALGTVQWGLDYGIANTSGMPSNDELKTIFELAKKAGIVLFDTAVQYGDAEKRVGQFSSPKSKIITKVGSFSKGNSLDYQLENSFNNLRRECIYGCLFHNINELNEDKGLWKELLAYKKESKIKKIGYSLYDPSELHDLLETGFVPDILQFPYSILDRKFEPYLELLKEKGVEIHIRSVFLQGLYFKPINELDSKYADLKQSLREIQHIGKENNLSMLELALCYVIQNKSIDYAVLGAETSHQLTQIISASKQKLSQKTIDDIKSIKLENQTMLNPVNWK